MSRSVEEYLEALYNLSRDDKTVSTTAISRRVKVAPASVTGMLRKLANEGYINYLPYQGVTLTANGLKMAEKVTRKHRLLERFLHDVLKIGNDKVHDQACEMEHALSDETARAMCRTLEAPDKCPDDGKVIPACDYGFSSCDECRRWSGENLDEVGHRKESVVAISMLKENQEGKIAFIRGNNKLLRRLVDLGLTPGTRISISRVAPLKGPVEIAVRGAKLALGESIACNVFIKKSSDK